MNIYILEFRPRSSPWPGMENKILGLYIRPNDALSAALAHAEGLHLSSHTRIATMSDSDTYADNYNAAVDDLERDGVRLVRDDEPTSAVEIRGFPWAKPAIIAGWCARIWGGEFQGFSAVWESEDEFRSVYPYVLTRHRVNR